jgi:hypothetical protein
MCAAVLDESDAAVDGSFYGGEQAEAATRGGICYEVEGEVGVRVGHGGSVKA